MLVQLGAASSKINCGKEKKILLNFSLSFLPDFLFCYSSKRDARATIFLFFFPFLMKFDLLLFNERAKDRQSIPIISFCLIFRPNLFLKMLHFSSTNKKRASKSSQRKMKCSSTIHHLQSVPIMRVGAGTMFTYLDSPLSLAEDFFFLSPLLICQLFQFVFFFFFQHSHE